MFGELFNARCLKTRITIGVLSSNFLLRCKSLKNRSTMTEVQVGQFCPSRFIKSR